MIDVLTGEMIDERGDGVIDPLAALDAAARAAADTLRLLERTKMDVALMERQAADLIAAQFPQLKELQKFQKNLEDAYTDAAAALRVAALDVWAALDAGASKSLLGGAVTIREVQRVTHYDPLTAVEWCQECAPSLLKIEANKAAIEKRLKAGAEVPPEVMAITTVTETAINGGALAAWGE